MRLCFDARDTSITFLRPSDTVPLHWLVEVDFLWALVEAVFGSVVCCILGLPNENLADCSC